MSVVLLAITRRIALPLVSAPEPGGEPFGQGDPEGSQSEQKQRSSQDKTALERHRLPQPLEHASCSNSPRWIAITLANAQNSIAFEADIDRGSGHDHRVLGKADAAEGDIAE